MHITSALTEVLRRRSKIWETEVQRGFRISLQPVTQFEIQFSQHAVLYVDTAYFFKRAHKTHFSQFNISKKVNCGTASPVKLFDPTTWGQTSSEE